MKYKIKRYCDDVNCGDASCMRCINKLCNILHGDDKIIPGVHYTLPVDGEIYKKASSNNLLLKEIKELLQKTDYGDLINSLENQLGLRFKMLEQKINECHMIAIAAINTNIDKVALKVKELSGQLDAAVGSIRDKISSTNILSDQKDDLNKIPYVCPKCKGDKYNVLRFEEGETCSIVCPTCNATGVIWK